MTEIYTHYCSGRAAVASMLTIYIAEAHASDRWFFPNAPDVLSGNAIISTHRSLHDRINAAKKFIDVKKFAPEVVVDSMQHHIMDRYEAWPERLFIIVDGVVVYKGGNGPFGYLLHEVQDWLAERYGMRGKSLNMDLPAGASCSFVAEGVRD
jgi:hypothetical protein